MLYFLKVFSEWKSNLRKRARLCNELTLDERRLQRSGNLTFTDLEERMLLLMGQPIPDGTLIVSERSRLVSHHHNSSSTTSYNMAIEDHDDDDDDDDLLSLQPNETIYLAADHDDGQKDISSSSSSSSPPLPDAKVIKNESIDDDECEWNNDDQLPPPKTTRRAIKRAIHSGTNGAKKTKTSSEYYLQRISETMDEQSGIVQNIQREIVSHSAKLCEIEKKIPDESVMKSIDRTLKNMFKFKLLDYASKRAQSVEQVLEELNKIDL